MATKRASNIWSEHDLRRQYERQTGELAVTKAGKPSGGYFAWLEDTVRIWFPELSAMMKREYQRTLAERKGRKVQMGINFFAKGGEG